MLIKIGVLSFITTFQNYYLEELLVIFFALTPLTHPSKRLKEAFFRRCFSKKAFLKILQYFQETSTGFSCKYSEIVENTIFYRTPVMTERLKSILEKVYHGV